MSAADQIKEIQRILGVADDGDFRKRSQAALDLLADKARAEIQVAFDVQELPFSGSLDERTEKNIATLLPKAQPVARAFMERLIPFMASKGVVAKIISGTRTYAEQNELYAKGRTKPGPPVTKARGGFSNHNFGVAFDIGLFRDGKYLKDSPLYKEAGPVGESVGLEWGGRWTSFTDEPHFEVPTGFSMAEKRNRVAAGKPIL